MSLLRSRQNSFAGFFLGKGNLSNPDGLKKTTLNNENSLGKKPCIAYEIEIEMESLSEKEIVFTLGAEESILDSKNIAYKYSKIQNCKQELENIKNKITEKDSNAQIEYISKQQELEKIKSKMKDNQNVLDEYNEENNPLPASFEIKTNADIKNIVDSIQEMPGIAQIVTYINANPYELYLQNK